MIETLYRPRLSASGILVQPVHGHRHHASLLEMGLLLAGLSTPIVALFDGVEQEEVERLRNSRRARHEASDSCRELATVAKIIEAEHRSGRDGAVEIIGVGTWDIFGVLDAKSIRGEFGDRFPGHVEADLAFAQHRAQHGGAANAATRKEFLEKEYGVKFSRAALSAVAQGMVEADLSSEVLDNVIARVERLILDSRV